MPISTQSFVDRDAARVWNYWFSHRDLSGAAEPVADPFGERYVLAQNLWFRGGDDVDAEITQQFGALVERAAAGEFAAWRDHPRSNLALVLLLDQFPRHIHRGTAGAFAHDAAALAVAEHALARGFDRELAPAEALFLFLALSHAEHLETVQRALAGITELATRCTRAQQRTARGWRMGTRKHIDVLERFGRYPHRNAALGRASTPEEQAFLERPEFTALFMRSQRPRTERDAAPGPAPARQPSATTGAQPQRGGPRLKILVLHGFRQNGDVFRARTRKLRDALNDVADLVYPTSPLVYTPQGDTREATLAAFGEVPEYPGHRVWWQASVDNREYQHVDATIAHLEQFVRANGPFDGVLGFAQGGTLAALLAAMQPHPTFAFKFAVCISAFPSRADAHAAYVRPGSVRVPALHVLGLNDILVTPDRSIALFEAFDPTTATLVKHRGGHFVPGSWPYPEIVAFVRGFLPAGAELAEAATDAPPPSLLGLAWEALAPAARGEPIDLPLALGIIQQMADHGHWRDLQALAVHAFGLRGPADRELEDSPLRALHDEIVDRFAARLRVDLAAAVAAERSKPGGATSPRTALLMDRLGVAPEPGAWPGPCARHAPRIGAHADKICHLARDVAAELFPREAMRAFILAREQQANDGPRSPAPPHLRRRAPQQHDLETHARRLSYQRYSQALSLICGVLAEQDPGRGQRLLLRELTPELLAERRGLPIARAVAEPEPEPVVPCSLADLDPLLGHLRRNLGVERQTAFNRGTLTVDGRLDLCKQVVGPDGIRPLLGAMMHSDRVKRLLLGNNIIGDGGAAAIAGFLRERKDSPLDCWYIAGNHIGPEGIAHVCAALQGDTRVTSLWLKRNPLKAAGMRPIAELLRANRTLQVLDLVNCGLLDDGLAVVLGALSGPDANTTLRHLYVGTNGVTDVSAPRIAEFLAGDCKLESLFLSCNRLGDEGVAVVARGLAANRTIRRVSLASNRVGPRGAEALAAALADHPSLEFIDLGFTKATVAVGELGNCIGDEGARAMARLLHTNTVVRSLDLLHNYISQRGVNYIREAMKVNHTLLTLQLTQFGKVHNEPGKEELRAALQRNRGRLTSEQLAAAERIDLPDHVREIYSVYRTHT